MTKTSVIPGIIAATLVLCQWFAFQSVRKYLFQKPEKISRRVAYPVLMAFGPIAILALRLEFGTEIFPPGTFSRQLASVIVFSYLGWVLMLSLFFLMVKAIDLAVEIKDALLQSAAPGRGSPFLRASQAGSVLYPGVTRHQDAEPQTREDQGSASTESAFAAGSAIQIDSRHPSRRTFFKVAAATSLVAATGLGVRGIAEAYGEPILEKYEFFHDSLQGIPEPLTLIHATDCHFGMFLGPRELRDLVDRLNSLEGDALCVTGDVFHSARAVVEQATPILRKLKARPLGNLAVLGNHDFYAGAERSAESLQAAGFTLLRNEWFMFRAGAATVHVGGIDDPSINWMRGKTFPGFDALMLNAPAKAGLRILLSHRPDLFPRAAQQGIDLVLAGHLHGGQIVIPVPASERGLSVADMVSEYTHGWYTRGVSRMYLSRGVGLTFLPWRINCRPEITLIRLNPTEKGTHSGFVHVA